MVARPRATRHPSHLTVLHSMKKRSSGRHCEQCGRRGHATMVDRRCPLNRPDDGEAAANGVCQRCGESNHLSPRSKKCKLRSLLPSQSPPPGLLAAGEEWYSFYGGTIKRSFRSFIKCSELREKVEAMVRSLTAIEHDASRLLNFHLLRLQDEQKKWPKLTDKFIRQFFIMVLKEPDELDKGKLQSHHRLRS